MLDTIKSEEQRMAVMRNANESPYMPGFDTDDYAPPEYRVIQAMSKAHTEAELPMGQFYCGQTGDLREILDFVILRVGRNYTNWDKNNLGFPVCASDDRIKPRPGGKFKGPCATCPALGQECFPGYNILGMLWEGKDSIDAPNLFLLRVNGTSVYPFRKLWAKVAHQYQNCPWKFVVNLTTEKKTNQSGTFYVMRPEMGCLLDEPGQTSMKALADNFLGLDINAVDGEAQQQQDIQSQDSQRLVDRPPSKVIDSQIAKGNQPRGITKGEAWQTVELANKLGVPEVTIASYIAIAFQPKTKLGELHAGEWAMLNKWLEQEYGQAAQTRQEEDELGDLPF